MSATVAKPRPYGVHTIGNMFARGAGAGLPDGRWVLAVGLPYQGTLPERLRAAWWIVTGRAQAVVWPEAGDLERVLDNSPTKSEPSL